MPRPPCCPSFSSSCSHPLFNFCSRCPPLLPCLCLPCPPCCPSFMPHPPCCPSFMPRPPCCPLFISSCSHPLFNYCSSCPPLLPCLRMPHPPCCLLFSNSSLHRRISTWNRQTGDQLSPKVCGFWQSFGHYAFCMKQKIMSNIVFCVCSSLCISLVLCVCVCVCVCMYHCVCVCAYVCVCVCVCVHVSLWHVYLCVCVCMCIVCMCVFVGMYACMYHCVWHCVYDCFIVYIILPREDRKYMKCNLCCWRWVSLSLWMPCIYWLLYKICSKNFFQPPSEYNFCRYMSSTKKKEDILPLSKFVQEATVT